MKVVLKMTRMKYRLLLALVAIFCGVVLITCIANSANASRVEWVEPITVVNGNQPLDFGVAPIASGTEEYATTIEEAALVLRDQLKNRKGYAVVYWRTLAYSDKSFYEMFDLAVAHTGNPKEGDYISRQYEKWSAQLSGYAMGNVYYLTLEYNISYYTTAAQESKVDAAVATILKQLNLGNATDYQKVKGVYDWLCQNVTYDYNHLADASYLRKHSTYAALIDRTAVCQGYATAMYRLLLELDVDIRYVGGWSYDNKGQSSAHGWNIVKLGKKYYNLDATWDATYKQQGHAYQCFLKNDTDFTYHVRNNTDYAFVNSKAYPMATNSYANEQFTVTFVDYDGSVLSKNTYRFGAQIVKPKDPQRAFANGIRYTFSGWDRAVGLCDGDQTFTAQYKETYEQFHVYFKDADGTELAHQVYGYGETIVAPKDPVKKADNVYTYRFNGWDKKVGTCTGDQVFTATYEKAFIDYTIQFIDEDGTLIAEGVYHYGDSITAPKDPVKKADNVYTYRFNGWDKKVGTCAGDQVFTATYEKAFIEYTIQFIDEDGTLIAEGAYHYGDSITAPKDPERTDNVYTYRFSGWDKKVGTCTGNQVFTATYEKTFIEYTIQFIYEDGTLIAEGVYHYGDSVSVPKEVTPLTGEDLVFVGWGADATKCYGSAVYIAQFAEPADRGDFDGDRIVSNGDVIYLLWYTMFPESYPIYESADYNADGEINNQDVIYLLWHTMFPESYPLQ